MNISVDKNYKLLSKVAFNAKNMACPINRPTMKMSSSVSRSDDNSENAQLSMQTNTQFHSETDSETAPLHLRRQI